MVIGGSAAMRSSYILLEMMTSSMPLKAPDKDPRWFRFSGRGRVSSSAKSMKWAKNVVLNLVRSQVMDLPVMLNYMTSPALGGCWWRWLFNVF